MKSSIKKLKNCKRLIEVRLTSERVKKEFDNTYENIGKVANIPGFRAGKAPRDLLERHYFETAKEEVLKRLIPESYKAILEEHKLDPIGYPEITEIKIDLNEGLFYKASIETRPDFGLKNYKALRLKKKKVEIKEEDVQKNLESLREMNAQSMPKKDSDNKEKVLPKLDDEFAKDLGFENLEKLKDAVRESLRQRSNEESQADLEMQIINQLVDIMNFDVPESLVNAEKDRLIKDANARIAYMEAVQKKQNIDKKITFSDKDKEELERNALNQGLRQVKAFFILDKIAQSEKIYVEKEEVEKRLEEIAKQYKKTKEEIRRHLEENNTLQEMLVNMRNGKVMQFLLKEAKIST